MRNTAPTDAAQLEALETREWLDSLDDVLKHGGPARVGTLAARARHPRPEVRRAAAVHGQHALHQHHPRGRAGAVSRRSRDRAPHQEPRPLERHGDGGARQQGRRRHRRPHLDVSLRRPRCTRSASTTSSAAATTATTATMVYFQGHASPGIYARAFLEGRLTRRAARELPPRARNRAAACRPIRIRG